MYFSVRSRDTTIRCTASYSSTDRQHSRVYAQSASNFHVILVQQHDPSINDSLIDKVRLQLGQSWDACSQLVFSSDQTTSEQFNATHCDKKLKLLSAIFTNWVQGFHSNFHWIVVSFPLLL